MPTPSDGAAGERRIGNRYRLVGRLGSGGMGTVWSARDEVLGRDVAIKQVKPPPGLSPEQQAEVRIRTLREARAAARIRSRSAVTVLDVVEEDGQPWIVMELLQARTLSDIIKVDGPLPADRVATIGLRLLEALRAAHESGVLHRDVKPGNVMLTDSGQVVLTDFGIATLDGDPTLTTSGMLIGSPAYLAPERARGGPATSATDLWSLGCLLFTAVEGRTPFDRGNPLATLTAVITEEPFPMPHAGRLEPVLRGLLEKDPDRRLSLERTENLLRPPVPGPAVAGSDPRRPPGSVAAGAPPVPRRSARRVVGVGSAVALVAVSAIVALALSGGNAGNAPAADAGGSGSGSEATSSQTTASTAAPSTTGSDSQSTNATATSTGPPAGFQLHTDSTGFTVAVPQGWTMRTEGPRTYFTDPQDGRFLEVDQTRTPQPDPVVDWQNQEAVVSQRLAGYQLIRIDPVDYRGWDAADWEFTWAADGGRLHVLNRNLITAPDRAYALYWSVPDAVWQQNLANFDVVAASFQPAT